jgi:AraC family transcriptional regulator, regulatory protein of adaptative response / methylated-DNA-[protein]-cysteine methyltransferase
MPFVDQDRAWKAVLAHDRRYDETFVYAVASTRVYCRPSCPSRRPDRRGVTFFPSPEQAEAAGFHACRRCVPGSVGGTQTERLVEQVRQYLDGHSDEAVTLTRLAARVGMNPFRLQRAFTRVFGFSPKTYQNAKRIQRFRQALESGTRVIDATYQAGFGSSSRASEQAWRHMGMTPSAFQSGGKGVTLHYASMRTPVGLLLIAATERGVTSVMFGGSEPSLVAKLRREYPNAMLRRNPKRLLHYRQALSRCLNGKSAGDGLTFDVKSTAFQLKIWTALQQIPAGSTRTYREIACMIGRPAASRAVARACATNPLALLIPCHRVVGHGGRLAGYRWGIKRKRDLLRLEAARRQRGRSSRRSS